MEAKKIILNYLNQKINEEDSEINRSLVSEKIQMFFYFDIWIFKNLNGAILTNFLVLYQNVHFLF